MKYNFDEFINFLWDQNYEELKKLIIAEPSYLSIKDNTQRQILSYLVAYGSFDLLKTAIENKANLNNRDIYGKTALTEAAYENKIDVLEYLIENNADVNIIPQSDSGGLIWKIFSTYKSNPIFPSDKVLKKIIDKSDKILAHDLEKLISSGNFDLYLYAIKSKKIEKTEIIPTIYSLFIKDSKKGFEILKFMIDNNYISIYDKYNSLYSFYTKKSLINIIAEATFSEDIFEYLFELGIDLKDDANEAVLLTYSQKDDLFAVKYFIDKAADINFIDKNTGRNALLAYSVKKREAKELSISPLFSFLVDNTKELTIEDDYNKNIVDYLAKNKRKHSLKYVFSKVITEFSDKLIDSNKKQIFVSLFRIQQFAPTKKDKELIVSTFEKFPEFHDDFIENLASEKLILKEIAVKVMSISDKYIKILKAHSTIETNKNIVKLINSYLETVVKSDITKKTDTINKKEIKTSSNKIRFSLEWYEEKAIEDTSTADIPWLKQNLLPKLVWSDKTNRNASHALVIYYIKGIYSPEGILPQTKYKQMLKLTTKLKESSLENLFDILFDELFKLKDKITPQRRWIFNILYLLAENNPEYLKKIEEKVQHMLYYWLAKTAGIIVRDMVYMINESGAGKTDWYYRNTKNKELKSAALIGLEIKAFKKNMTVDEYRDKLLVSSSGFYKGKDIVSIHKKRLEEMFMINSLKIFSFWEELYVKNTSFNVFATNLFWAVYSTETPNKPEMIFRYDGESIVNINGKKIKIKKDSMVGLLHPLEVSKEELNMMNSLIKVQKIKQPIKQIKRNFFVPELNDNENTSIKFNDLKFNVSKGYDKLKNSMWEAVVWDFEQGLFYEFMLELPNYTRIRLKFEGGIISDFEEGCDDCDDKYYYWKELIFQNGDIGIPISKVNKRVYSEIFMFINEISK